MEKRKQMVVMFLNIMIHIFIVYTNWDYMP